jgi:hypothetical protein
MAKKVEVEIDVKSNVDGSIAQLKELKLQLKKTAAGSEEFKKLYNQIDDLEDKIKSAKNESKDWVDTLESAGGPLGALGGAINKVKVATKSWGAAINAIGIGLIVSAVAGLVGAFSQTEGSMKKLEPLLIGMEKIFGGILEVIQPLLDAFLELALKALPYVTSGIGKLYSGMVAFFTLLKEAGTGAGKILKGIFTLDTDSITEGYEQIKGSLGKTLEAYDEGVKRFEAGTKKITKTEKENLKERGDAADKALQEKLKRLETEDKLDEAKLAKLKAEAMETAFSEEQKLAVEKTFSEKSYQLKLKDIEDKQKLYNKDSVEYKALEAEKINLQAENLVKTKEFIDKEIQLNEQRGKELIDFEVQLVKRLKELAEEKETKDLADKKEKAEKTLRFLELNGQALLRGTKSYYDNRKALITELEKQELDALKLEYDKKKLSKEEFEVASKNIQIKYSQQRKDLSQLELNDYLQFATQILSAVSGIFSAASNVAKMQTEQDIQAAEGNVEKIEAIKQKAFEDNKKMQIAQAIIGTLQSAIQAYQSLAVIPVVGVGLGIAAAAAALVFGYKQVALIKAQTYQSASSGQAAGGVAAAIPTYSGGPTAMSTPQIQGTQPATPGSQIAETLGATTGKPIKAYVVSGEISSQQALDRRTNRAATFGVV